MEPRGGVAAIVLAAGEARRFGGRKQLAVLDGRTLLEHVIDIGRTAGLAPIVAVVPVWLTRPAAFTDPALRWVRNPHPERGMSESLRLGFDALPPTAEAALILLGDQPRLPPSAVASILAARGTRPIVAARVDGHPAPPVLVERPRFSIVDAATGDAGLREVLAAHPEWVSYVELPVAAIDVDTPQDLERLAGAD